MAAPSASKTLERRRGSRATGNAHVEGDAVSLVAKRADLVDGGTGHARRVGAVEDHLLAPGRPKLLFGEGTARPRVEPVIRPCGRPRSNMEFGIFPSATSSAKMPADEVGMR